MFSFASGSSRGPLSRSAPLLFVAFLPHLFLPSVAAGREVTVLHVDAASGVDSPERGGDAAQPFASLRYALAFAESSGADDIELRLASGIYDHGVERFPIRFEGGLRAVRVRAPHGEVLFRSESAALRGRVPLFVADALLLTASQFEVSFHDVRFDGGVTALRVNGNSGVSMAVELEDCGFSSQLGGAVEIALGREATAQLDVVGCTFRGSYGGVHLEAALSASVDVIVERCSFDALGAFGISSLLGAGVSLHIDPRASLDVRVERSLFRRLSAGVLLTTSEPEGQADEGGFVDLAVVNNVVEDVTNGAYFSLWPHHATSLLIANNTFARVGGFAIYHDNLEQLRAEDLVDGISWTFANNICVAFEQDSEFDVEIGSDAGVQPFPAGVIVRHNLLQKSRLGAARQDGNLSWDSELAALFVDYTAGDYHLRPGTAAIDSGNNSDVVDSVDFAGGCRLGSAICGVFGDAVEYVVDRGAFEHALFCDSEPAHFLRGDCNSGQDVDIADAITSFNYLFVGNTFPTCLDACDTDDNGGIDISDGIALLNFLFVEGGAVIPDPGIYTAGQDPSPDCLTLCK